MKIFNGQFYDILPANKSKIYVLRGEIYPLIWPQPPEAEPRPVPIRVFEGEIYNKLPSNRVHVLRGDIYSSLGAKTRIFPEGEAHISVPRGVALASSLSPGVFIGVPATIPRIQAETSHLVPTILTSISEEVTTPMGLSEAIVYKPGISTEVIFHPPKSEAEARQPIPWIFLSIAGEFPSPAGLSNALALSPEVMSGGTIASVLASASSRANHPLAIVGVEVESITSEATASSPSPSLVKLEIISTDPISSLAQFIAPDILVSDSIIEAIPGLSTARVNKPPLGSTMEAEEYSIEISGVDIKTYGFYLLKDSKRELLVKRKVRQIDLLGRPGVVALGSRLSPRLLELVLAVDTEDPTLAKDRLAELFRTGEIQELRFLDDPGRVYLVRYMGQSTVTDWIEGSILNIPLILADPYIYSTENILTGSGIINNQGTEETPLIVEIEGPASDIDLRIGDNQVRFRGSVGGTERLVIDGVRYEVTIDEKNAINLFEGDITPIPPGEIPVFCSSSSVTWRWRNRWVA